LKRGLATVRGAIRGALFDPTAPTFESLRDAAHRAYSPLEDRRVSAHPVFFLTARACTSPSSDRATSANVDPKAGGARLMQISSVA